MTLKLDLQNKDGEFIHYEQPKVSFGMMDKLMEFNADSEKLSLKKQYLDSKLSKGTITPDEFNERLKISDDESKQADQMVDLIVKLFNNPKVNSKTIKNGLELSNGIDKLSQVLTDAMGGTHSAAGSAVKK